MPPSRESSAFVIEGGRPLKGAIGTSGSKNATLGAMAATLLVEDECVLTNVPKISDIDQMAGVLRSLGAKVEWDGPHTLRITASGLNTSRPDRAVAASLRGSFAIMGALLSRLGEAACPPPGGDVIGLRPVDVHLKGFAALGAEVLESPEWFELRVTKRRGADIFNDYPSVLGTQNLMMAAATAEGTTTIVNAAAEPEVQGLAEMLRGMGAMIRGEGTSTIVVEGVKALRGTEYAIIPDRLEAGTYAIAAAITGGDVELRGTVPEHLTSLIHKLREAGVTVGTDGDCIRVQATGDLRAVTIQALPYPGFATDLQAPMAVLLTQASGLSRVMERVFDNRLLYVDELRKMGAKIDTLDSTTAIIDGPTLLTGALVKALDVRAGAALVLAGLAATGVTEITDIRHIDRGYEAIDERLRMLGARMERRIERE
jgi:UDP-N-acetylglucosamine 1-carboxyvinyltransferase